VIRSGFFALVASANLEFDTANQFMASTNSVFDIPDQFIAFTNSELQKKGRSDS
jgi:hypothetical protein